MAQWGMLIPADTNPTMTGSQADMLAMQRQAPMVFEQAAKQADEAYDKLDPSSPTFFNDARKIYYDFRPTDPFARAYYDQFEDAFSNEAWNDWTGGHLLMEHGAGTDLGGGKAYGSAAAGMPNMGADSAADVGVTDPMIPAMPAQGTANDPGMHGGHMFPGAKTGYEASMDPAMHGGMLPQQQVQPAAAPEQPNPLMEMLAAQIQQQIQQQRQANMLRQGAQGWYNAFHPKDAVEAMLNPDGDVAKPYDIKDGYKINTITGEVEALPDTDVDIKGSMTEGFVALGSDGIKYYVPPLAAKELDLSFKPNNYGGQDMYQGNKLVGRTDGGGIRSFNKAHDEGAFMELVQMGDEVSPYKVAQNLTEMEEASKIIDNLLQGGLRNGEHLGDGAKKFLQRALPALMQRGLLPPEARSITQWLNEQLSEAQGNVVYRTFSDFFRWSTGFHLDQWMRDMKDAIMLYGQTQTGKLKPAYALAPNIIAKNGNSTSDDEYRAMGGFEPAVPIARQIISTHDHFSNYSGQGGGNIQPRSPNFGKKTYEQWKNDSSAGQPGGEWDRPESAKAKDGSTVEVVEL